jgi:hypothetical protein
LLRASDNGAWPAPNLGWVVTGAKLYFEESGDGYPIIFPRIRLHSDKEKFRSDLNRPESYEMSERLLKTLRKSGDFQTESEGSIPSTRSSAPAKARPAKFASNPQE